MVNLSKIPSLPIGIIGFDTQGNPVYPSAKTTQEIANLINNPPVRYSGGGSSSPSSPSSPSPTIDLGAQRKAEEQKKLSEELQKKLQEEAKRLAEANKQSVLRSQGLARTYRTKERVVSAKDFRTEGQKRAEAKRQFQDYKQLESKYLADTEKKAYQEYKRIGQSDAQARYSASKWRKSTEGEIKALGGVPQYRTEEIKEEIKEETKIEKPGGVVSPAQTTRQRIKSYFKPDEGEKVYATILSTPKRLLTAVSEELKRLEDIRQQKTKDFYQSQASINLMGELPRAVYFNPLGGSILMVSGGSEKLLTPSGQEQIRQNILGIKEKGYSKTTSNVLGYGIPIAETGFGLLGLRSYGKGYVESKRVLEVESLANKMISKQDKLLAKNLKERLERLKVLDRGASKLGLNVPSAYEEAVSVGRMNYLGAGKKVLSKSEITVLTKTATEVGITKSTKEGKRLAEDIGVYNLPYQVVPPKEITLYKGQLLDIPKQIELTNLKYTPRYTQQGKVIGTSMFVQRGKETLGLGFTGEVGKRRVINKNLFIYRQGKSGIGRFDIIESGRKSTRYIQTEGGKLKLEISPFGRRIETQLVKTKLLGQQKVGNQITRLYESEYSLVPTKIRRVYRAETPSSLGRLPTKKQFKESFKLSKDLTRDIITKEKPIISYTGEGRIKATGENIAGTYKETKKLSLPYKQKLVSVRLSKGADITKTGETSNIILTSGKKSSEQYLKYLYQQPKILPKVERTIKITIPSTKTISLPKVEPEIKLTSIFTGKGTYERYSPSENIFTRTIEPTEVKGVLGESRIPSLTGMGISDLGAEGRFEDLGVSSSGRLGDLDLIRLGQETKAKTKIQEMENLFIKSKIDLEIKPSEKVREQTKLQEKQQEQLKSKLSQQPNQQLKQLQLGKLKLLRSPRQIQRPPQTKQPIIPIIPILKLPSSQLSRLAKKTETEPELYSAIGFRFGKEVSLGLGTKEKVRQKLKGFLSETLGASGYLKFGEEKLKAEETGLLKEFTFRKSKKSPFLIVEEKTKRLKRGTGEIPEIQYFRKKSKSSII